MWIFWRVIGLLNRLVHPEKNDLTERCCPWCLYKFNLLEKPWFKATRSGSGFDGERTNYWVEGVQTCPRCHYSFFVGDCS